MEWVAEAVVSQSASPRFPIPIPYEHPAVSALSAPSSFRPARANHSFTVARV